MTFAYRKYNIFTFTKNYDNDYGNSHFWSKVAEVNASLDIIKNMTPIISNNKVEKVPKIIFKVNDLIFDQIRSVQGKISPKVGEWIEPKFYSKSEIISLNGDAIEILFLGTMRFRRCTVYLVIQFNYLTLQVRILAYGTDEILKNDQNNFESFGTDLENVHKDQIVEEIENLINARLLSNNLNINSTAFQKIKKGQYVLFV